VKLATDRLDGRGGDLGPIDRASDQSVLRLGRIIAADHEVRHLNAPVVAKQFDSCATIIRAPCPSGEIVWQHGIVGESRRSPLRQRQMSIARSRRCSDSPAPDNRRRSGHRLEVLRSAWHDTADCDRCGTSTDHSIVWKQPVAKDRSGSILLKNSLRVFG